MNIDSENSEPIQELRRRKKAMRERLAALSPTEKIRHLEALQERYYEVLRIRQDNGGLPIPSEWVRWRKAQNID